MLIPIDFNADAFFNLRIKLASAFGFNVLSLKNSNPGSKIEVSTTSPISEETTSSRASLPVVDPIETTSGKILTCFPGFIIFNLNIPPNAVFESVEYKDC